MVLAKSKLVVSSVHLDAVEVSDRCRCSCQPGLGGLVPFLQFLPDLSCSCVDGPRCESAEEGALFILHECVRDVHTLRLSSRATICDIASISLDICESSITLVPRVPRPELDLRVVDLRQLFEQRVC